MAIKQIKKILRRSKIARKLYYYPKRVIVQLLSITPIWGAVRSYSGTVDVTFPLRDLFKFRKLSLIKIVRPYTQAGYSRLTNVYDLVRDIKKRKVGGAFVECGTWKGGCAAIMGGLAQQYGMQRKTWYVDSYEGMPEPTKEDGDRADRLTGDVLKASVHDVEELIFEKMDLPKEHNIIVKGWFEDILPQIKKDIGTIAILRLDADWYSSTLMCLNELYEQVASGGYIIFDDYATWPGCRKAVHEFLDTNRINVGFNYIGTHDPIAFSKGSPIYFRKP